MSDSFTERTSRSWFQRIGSSFGAAGVGIILILACLVGLFWNEGRAVKTARSLTEGAGLVREVSASAPDAANDGALVHISGPVTALGAPRDPDTGVSASGTIGLRRSVEMYQWKEETRSETRTKLGGGEETVTTYTYVREWSSSAINSSNFKRPDGHSNPSFPVSSQSFRGDGAKLGGFTLEPGQLAGLGSEASVQLSGDVLRAVGARYAAGRRVEQSGDAVVIGNDPVNPQVGDLRISYFATRLDAASFVGRQQGNRLTPYRTSGGRDLFLAEDGVTPAAAMFQNAQSANATMTWILRAVGMFLLFVGFRMLLGFLGVFGDVIPFVGRIVRGATGLVAFSLALILGSTAIALGWIAYRPLIGGAILLVGVGLGFLLLRRGRPAASAQPA